MNRSAWRPRITRPPRPVRTPADSLALWIGTGLGSGFVRPFSATWGSLAGMAYLAAWSALPGILLQTAVGAAVLLAGVWAAGRCERLFAEKDPKSVVIDEIAPIPLAFWPLWAIHEGRWWTWVGAFVLYRVADVLKPWPARQSETLRGGVGIMADDVISSIYTAAALALCERFLA